MFDWLVGLMVYTGVTTLFVGTLSVVASIIRTTFRRLTGKGN